MSTMLVGIMQKSNSKSTSGWIFTLGVVIPWESKKKNYMALFGNLLPFPFHSFHFSQKI
jgi:hypothetical protein